MGKPSAAAQGEQAGASKKAKLVQVGDSYMSLKDIIRIYCDAVLDAKGEPVYRIVFRYFKGYDFEEYVTWSDEEGEKHRDQEYAELATRLEQAGYDLL